MSDKKIYVYGFINTSEEKNLGYVGIEGGEVYTQPYRDISAVVSDSPFTQFDFLPRETLLLHLAVYQAVIEKVMRNHYIIPMKFGTVAEGKEEVKRILKKGYNRIKISAMAMGDRIELDAVAMWSNLDAVLKSIGEEEEIKKFKEEAESQSPDKNIEARISLGKMVKVSLDGKRKKYASEILGILRRKSENYLVHDVMDDSMIMNTAFLIAKDNQEIFESKVDQLDEKYHDRVNFRIVGPLPPYSFCTFEMKKTKFSDINKAREMLDLDEVSTILEIKGAYWEKGKKFHPDRYPGDVEAQKRFEDITKAYRLLSSYCNGEQCSFKEESIREWIIVRPMEQLGEYAQ